MAKKKIQTDIFGEVIGVDNREKLYLEDISRKQNFKHEIAVLNGEYTMEELRQIVALIRHVAKQYIFCDEDTHKPIKCMDINKGGLKLKMDYLVYAGVILCSERNFYVFYTKLDSKTRTLLDYLFMQGYAEPETLNEKTEFKWVNKEVNYWRRNDYVLAQIPEAGLVTKSNSSWSSFATPNVHLREHIWGMYAKAVFPKRYAEILKSDGQDELLDTDGRLMTYCNEMQMGNFINVIQQMLKQNAVDFGAKKMTAAVVKKMAKQLTFPEFLTDNAAHDQKTMAAVLALPVLALSLEHWSQEVSRYWIFLREMVKGPHSAYVLFDMLGHLSGLRRDFILDTMEYDEFKDILVYVLKHVKPEKWYDVHEIEMRMYAHPALKIRKILPLSPAAVERYTISTSGLSALKPWHIRQYIQLPLFYGYLALFAGCGLLEIAYDKSGEYETSVYDMIEYVRLTPLGEYVFGISEIYEAQNIHHSSEYFEVDAERLIIRSVLIDGQNPYQGILNNIAERISDKRYRVSSASFLANCNNLTDIIAKQNFFKENICAEPSPVWMNFFLDMQRRCHPLKQTEEQYSVRRISANDKELQRIFQTDAYLRKHTLRGEDFTILIQTRFMKQVEQKLREYGYLV